MTEKLLQFIWQFQYFNKGQLTTTDGTPLAILHPGQLNTHQGPDFFNGRIKLDQTEWAGHIEVHVLSSLWKKHGHQNDQRYGKVILHVVWQHDCEVMDENGVAIPTFSLQHRVAGSMVEKHNHWMKTADQIPCGSGMAAISDLVWQSWQDRLLAERLLEKCSKIAHELTLTTQHWDEIYWRLLCKYIAGPVNAESFLQIAQSLPINLLGKYSNQLIYLEALLLGQAGLLHPNFTDPYPALLFREYQFLQKKHQLRVINQPPSFLRMRPDNFPTIRLAQLAMMVHKGNLSFSKVVQANEPKDIYNLYLVTANDYWHYHYTLQDSSGYKPKKIGNQTIQLLIINAIIPALFSYGHHQLNDKAREKALSWIEKLPAENNMYTRTFEKLGRKANSAGGSQAMIRLKQEYCDAKRCLECRIGTTLLRPTVQDGQ